MYVVRRSGRSIVILVICLVVLLGAPSTTCGVRAEAGVDPVTAAQTAASPLGLSYQWHTFYGIPTGPFELRTIAVDSDGNAYVAGYASATWGSPLHAFSGDYDIVVMKLSPLGAYQWHTFYGAAPTASADGDDEASGIAVDAAGNVYVTGYSDRTWQGPGNLAPVNPHGGDAEYWFVLKLDTNGAYQWHTFYQPGRANAVAVDTLGNAYISGYSTVEWGSPIHSAAGTSGKLAVLKLDSGGDDVWHTYYGGGAGAEDEVAYDVTTDAANSVYITGASVYTWLGDGATAPLVAFSGGAGYSSDIVVLKLTSAGAYQWHTFGGADGYDDVGYGISWGAGRVFVTGESFDTWGSPLHAITGERDIAVVALSDSGARQWNTFYGSNANDFGTGIAVAANGNVYVGGYSSASWSGSGGESPRHAYSGAGNADIAVLKLNANGAYLRHTFYGAAGTADLASDIALDSAYGVFTTGTSAASWLGDGGASPIHAYSGNDVADGFVLKLYDRVYRNYVPLVVRQQ